MRDSTRSASAASRLWLLILLLTAFRAVGLQAQDSSEEQQSKPPATEETQLEPIRVKVNLVTLRFTIRDEAGKFVNDLKADDFQVSENGRDKEISFFEEPREQTSDSRPLWLAFLLDVSGSTFATRAEEILAAQSFFDNVHQFTRVGIFGFTDKLMTFQDFTSNRGEALKAFSAARAHLGKTAIYGSADALISEMARHASPGDRKAIILVSDGMDDAYQRVSSAVALAREHKTTIYTVWVPSAAQLYLSPTGDQASAERETAAKQQAFARLATGTGGKHYGGFESILDFDNVLAEINDELFGNLYSIGYYTDEPYLERDERRISIRVRREGVSVHGIFEKAPDRVEAKRRYIAALFDTDPTTAIGSRNERFREIPADLDLLRPRGETEPSLPFRLKVGSFSLARGEGGGVHTQFGLIGLLMDLNGKEVARLREVFRAHLSASDLKDGRSIIYNNRIVAPPGNYLFKVVLLEIPTWRMTVLEQPVRIQPVTD
jgi:VWFA-related protein